MVVVSQPGRCDGLMPVSKLVHMRGGESVDLSLDVSLRSVGFVDFDGTFDNHSLKLLDLVKASLRKRLTDKSEAKVRENGLAMRSILEVCCNVTEPCYTP